MSYLGTKPNNGMVTTPQIADGNVTGPKIADAAITAAKISSGQTLPLNGVAFPATQVPSADPNTLDDYEEGTFTPVIQNASGSESISITGSYIKIGRQVTIMVGSYGTNVTALSATSHIHLRGLPFTAGTTAGVYQYAGSIMSQYPSQPVSLIDISGTQAPMYAPANGQDWTPFTRNTWGGTTSISFRFYFTYMAAA